MLGHSACRFPDSDAAPLPSVIWIRCGVEDSLRRDVPVSHTALTREARLAGQDQDRQQFVVALTSLATSLFAQLPGRRASARTGNLIRRVTVLADLQ